MAKKGTMIFPCRMADATNAVPLPGMSTGNSAAPGLPLSVTLTGVCGGLDLTSPSIKRNLNII